MCSASADMPDAESLAMSRPEGRCGEGHEGADVARRENLTPSEVVSSAGLDQRAHARLSARRLVVELLAMRLAGVSPAEVDAAVRAELARMLGTDAGT